MWHWGQSVLKGKYFCYRSIVDNGLLMSLQIWQCAESLQADLLIRQGQLDGNIGILEYLEDTWFGNDTLEYPDSFRWAEKKKY